MEKPFQFLSDYYGSHKKLKRDFSVKPGKGELALDSNWQICAPREKSPLLDWALSDFCKYLQNCLDIKVNVHSSASPKRASASIILEKTARDAEEKKTLSAEGSFHISCSENKAEIRSLSDMGLKEALFYLEDQMSLKEAPVLKKETTTRIPLRKDRICLMPQFGNYEEYLSILSHYGFNGIGFTPNTDLKPREIKKEYEYSYEEIIEKTKKYGIGIWSLPNYSGGSLWRSHVDKCLSSREVRTMLRAIGKRHTIPGMKGFIVLYEAIGLMFSKTCFCHDIHPEGDKIVREKGIIITKCPRCKREGGPEIVYARMIQDLYEGMKSVESKAEMTVWPYAWPDLAKNMDIDKFLSHLPKEVIFMPTWEQTIKTRKGALVFDYSIARVGPSQHVKEYTRIAGRHGLRNYAVAHTSSSVDVWGVPYIQTPLEWIKRYRRINSSQVEGSLETVMTGFHPSFVGELAKWFSWKPLPDGKRLLEEIIKRDFGINCISDVISAWKRFGKAIQYAPMSLEYIMAWIVKTNIDYLVKRELWPRSVFKIKKEVELRVKEWDKGVELLKKAYEKCEPSKRQSAEKILSVAVHTGQIFKTAKHCVLFAVKKSEGITDNELIKAELKNKEAMLKTIQADSRLGEGGWTGTEVKSPFFKRPRRYLYLPKDIQKAIAQLKNVGLELAQDPETGKPAVAVEVKNTSAQAVTAALQINACPEDWQIEKKIKAGPIKKGETQAAYLVVNNINKQDAPVKLRLTAKIGDEIVEATREIRKIWVMPRLKAQIKIDGALTEEEWGQAEVMKIDKQEQIVVGDEGKWKGAKDLSGTIFTLWDEKNLYLGAKVKCRHLIQNKKEAEINRIYDGTCLELFLSLNPITAIWNSSPKENDYQLSFAPKTKDNPHCYFFGVKGQGKVIKLTGIAIAACQVAGGYEMEIKIPWSNFEGFKPEAGQVIGFDVAIDGANEKGNREYQMVWAGTSENCRDVSAFAKVILKDE